MTVRALTILQTRHILIFRTMRSDFQYFVLLIGLLIRSDRMFCPSYFLVFIKPNRDHWGGK